jgi:hypothetical protein
MGGQGIISSLILHSQGGQQGSEKQTSRNEHDCAQAHHDLTL